MEIKGFDTETTNGYVKLLACSDGTYIETDDTEKLLEFLLIKGKDSNYNVFYNINYDISCILKPYIKINWKKLRQMFLDKIKQKEEYDEEESLYSFNIGTKYKIELFSGKSFVIKGKVKKFSKKQNREYLGWKKVYFFDCANFYSENNHYVTLDYAAQKYLNDRKNAEALGIDRKRLGEEIGYYEKYRDIIIKYCVKDCTLTRDLFLNTINSLNHIGLVMPKRPFSKATIHKQYWKDFGTMKNEITAYKDITDMTKQYGYLSYHGGIFFSPGIGTFEDVYDIDINSAYPTMMSKLPSLYNIKIHNIDSEDFNKSFFKFYKIKMKPNPYIQTKIKNRIHYAYGEEDREYYITEYDKKILDMYNQKYVIESGVGIETLDPVYPFKYLKRYYDEKTSVKKKFGKESSEYSLIKIFLNGGYGLLAQKKPRPTKYTNFIYASYITAYCRWKVMELRKIAEDNGDIILNIATDGLMIKKNSDKAYNIFKTQVSDELGDLSLDDYQSVTQFENGIYIARTEYGEEILKQRGFPQMTLEDLELASYVLKFSHSRPTHYAESIIQQKTEFLSMFILEEKAFDPYKYIVDHFEPIEEHWEIKDYFIKNKLLNIKHI